MKALGQGVHGNSSAERVENLLLGIRIERSRHVREQRLLGIVAVEVLDGVAHRFRRPAQTAGNAPADVGQAAGADAGQAASPAQDLFLFLVGELREPAALFHPVLVGRQERIDQRGQEAHVPPAVEQDRQPDQATLAPAVDRLGGDVQLLADFLERQHRLGHVLDGQGRHRVGQFRQEQAQIMNHVAADDQQIGVFRRTEIGHAVTEERVRIRLIRVDFVEQLLGPGELLEPAFRRCKPHLLIREFFQGLVFEGFHG